MRISVFGAGGLGCYLGAEMAWAGHDVTLVTRGEHLESIRQAGLRVGTDEGTRTIHLPAVERLSEAPPADLVLVTTKAFSLDEAAHQLASASSATVAPLVNGVDAAVRLETGGVGAERIVSGAAYVTAFRVEPGVVRRQGRHGRVTLGATAASAAGRLGRAAEVLESTGLDVTATDDIEAALWSKMALVCALVTACAISRGDLGTARARPAGADLLGQAVDEVGAVARGAQVGFPPTEADRIGRVLATFPDGFHPSLINDVLQGRPTEIDALNGTICRLGGRVGVDTPVARATVQAVNEWQTQLRARAVAAGGAVG